MWFNLIIVSLLITGLFAVAIGMSVIFNKSDEHETLSCKSEPDTGDKATACAACQIKEIVACSQDISTQKSNT